MNWQNYQAENQISLFDLDFAFGKMCLEPCQATTEMTSELSWKNLSTSKNRMLQFLDVRRNGQMQDLSSEMIGALHGESWMLNIGEFPKEERESHLSWILQIDAPEKYCLSPRACKGILNRASRRGKELPEVLKNALQDVVNNAIPSNCGIQAQIQEGGCRTLDSEGLVGNIGLQSGSDTFLTDRKVE